MSKIKERKVKQHKKRRKTMQTSLMELQNRQPIKLCSYVKESITKMESTRQQAFFKKIETFKPIREKDVREWKKPQIRFIPPDR